MFERWAENGLLDVLEEKGMGCIAFSPLAQGLLTNKYLNGIPKDSRAGKVNGALQSEQITTEILSKINALNEMAKERNQSLAQRAIVWLLKDVRITSVLIGASSVEQLVDNVKSLNNLTFEKKELESIEAILN